MYFFLLLCTSQIQFIVILLRVIWTDIFRSGQLSARPEDIHLHDSIQLEGKWVHIVLTLKRLPGRRCFSQRVACYWHVFFLNCHHQGPPGSQPSPHTQPPPHNPSNPMMGPHGQVRPTSSLTHPLAGSLTRSHNSLQAARRSLVVLTDRTGRWFIEWII